MSTRIYNFGRLASPANSGTFSVDETSYTYTLSATTWSTGTITPPIDQSDASGWYASYSGYQNPYWSVNFSASLPVYMLKISTSAPNTVTLRGYDGTSWVVITTFSGNLTLVLNGSVSYSGFKVDTTEGGYTNIYNFSVYNFEVAFIFNTDPITVEGVECDDEVIGNQVITGNSGLLLDNPETITLGDREVNILSAENISDLEYFTITSRNFTGYEEEHPFELANNAVNNKIGYFTDDAEQGTRSRNRFNVLLSDIELGVRSRNRVGNDTDDINISSQASTKYNLTVTPTHQYKSMPVVVDVNSRTSAVITGKYSVTLNDVAIIQPSVSDDLINNITFTISPSQLTTGINKARIKLFYPNGSQEYLDFEVVKEEPKRTIAQRLFRDYDGGFDGNSYAPPKILVPSTYPCWGLPENNPTVIKTTEYTRIPLKGYLSLSGVNIVGSGLSILVSFDKGVTWKSFISNVWTSVDIANISTLGMTVATINTITLAQWTDSFMPTSIDFAVYFNKPPITTLLAVYVTSGSFKPDKNIIVTSTALHSGGINTATITIYSNLHPTGYTQSAYQQTLYYTVSSNELVTLVNYTLGTSKDVIIYGYNVIDAYLKSITVNMTPSPFTGYAFII
ncbi:MAG: hypothetical protein H6Q70_530 [Firmicutes bacterium]|nr:hypothetical protein [Bacillota bacterium]